MRRNFLKILGSYFVGFLVYPFSSAIANNVIGYSLKCGHFLAEEKPKDTLKAILKFCKE